VIEYENILAYAIFEKRSIIKLRYASGMGECRRYPHPEVIRAVPESLQENCSMEQKKIELSP
jgi:hypothetical protein